MTYPTLEEILQCEDDDCLFSTQRSLFSVMPKIFMFFLLVGLVVWINSFFGEDFAGRYPWYFQPRVLGIFPLLMLVEIARVYYNDLYILGRERVRRHQGRLSLQYNVPSVMYKDIRLVSVSQSFWGRIFDYGSIFLGTAAQDEVELIIEGVASPYELSGLIEQLRDYNLSMISDEGQETTND